MHKIEGLLIGGAGLLFLSVIASKASGRLGVPSLLVFLGVGMLAGSEGPGGFYFDNPSFVQALGVVALALILFFGGLETAVDKIRPVFWSGFLLATLGVLLTTVLVGWFSATFLGFTPLEGVLLGAIISPTDAAAVFTVLRSRGINFKGQIKQLLEMESGSNDPMAVFLTVSILQLIVQSEPMSPLGLIPKFFQQMVPGAVLGFAFGQFIRFLINRMKLEFEGLYPVLTVSLVVFTYSFVQLIGGNGFLAVYVCGLTLGQGKWLHKRGLILFHDGLAWLMQIAMFLALGLQVFPSKLMPVAGTGMLLSSFLIFIARPASVFLSLMGTQFSMKEKLMISWVGLRGAVPIILATFPFFSGLPKADTIFHLVFFIVLTSVLIQGTTITLIAKWLGISAGIRTKFRYPLEFFPTGTGMKEDLVEIEVPKGSPAVGQSLVDLGFPKNSLIVLIQRSGDVFVPRGSTRLEADDTMLILAENEALSVVTRIVSPVVSSV